MNKQQAINDYMTKVDAEEYTFWVSGDELKALLEDNILPAGETRPMRAACTIEAAFKKWVNA